MEIKTKPSTTIPEQIRIYKKRGLIIRDEQYAYEVLSRVSYYRLSAYTLSLKDDDVFQPGITFEHLYLLYEFDKRLRNLLLEHLESIEIAFRSNISNLLAQKYGPLGYKDSSNFINTLYHQTFLSTLEDSLEQKGELFIEHHRQKYNAQFPIWVAIEVTSFGTLSKLYFNMKNEDKKIIAKNFEIHYTFLSNWLYVLSYLRNICAHFSRVYNKTLVKKAKIDKKYTSYINNATLFPSIIALLKLAQYDARMTFITQLSALISEYREVVELERIGFPSNWFDILNVESKISV